MVREMTGRYKVREKSGSDDSEELTRREGRRCGRKECRVRTRERRESDTPKSVDHMERGCSSAYFTAKARRRPTGLF